MIYQFLNSVKSRPSTDEVFNPWRDYDASNDIDSSAPEHRFSHLKNYMTERLSSAQLLIIAEAPGMNGAKFSGLAMTSERRLIEENILNQNKPYFTGPKYRTSKSILANQKSIPTGSLEPTATIVWGRMLELMDSHAFVLWNSFAWHPHHNGNSLSNRTPTDIEISSGLETLKLFLASFPDREVVAVGRKAELALNTLGVKASPVRHPANGGANKFRDGVKEILSKNK
jgi:hypothetical protein